MKKLFAVLAFAAVLSCAPASWAFDKGLFPLDEPAMENEYEPEMALSDMAFSQNPSDWTAVIVKQDSGQRVLIRLYGKAKDGVMPKDALAGVSGIDSPRTWIGNASGEGNSGDGYVIIEGTAASEDDARNARVNWIGYDENGRTLIQDFSGSPIMVNEMSGTVTAPAKSGGCDAGFGGLFSSFVIASLAAVSCARRSETPIRRRSI